MSRRYGKRPDEEAIANADKAKVTTYDQKLARWRHAQEVVRRMREDEEKKRENEA